MKDGSDNHEPGKDEDLSRQPNQNNGICEIQRSFRCGIAHDRRTNHLDKEADDIAGYKNDCKPFRTNDGARFEAGGTNDSAEKHVD